jgi:hypothetical protein
MSTFQEPRRLLSQGDPIDGAEKSRENLLLNHVVPESDVTVAFGQTLAISGAD